MSKHWNHNIHYHCLVLSDMPAICRQVLDVGCGEGLLTRELALSGKKVVGIDLDDASLQMAIAENDDMANIVFVKGDVMSYPFSPESFDMIASIATLHHLPLVSALTRFRGLISPGGVLIIIGLYKTQSIADYFYALLGLPLSFVFRRIKPYKDIKAATSAPKQSMSEIRQAAKTILPGVVIRRRLLFRYSLKWVKPSKSPLKYFKSGSPFTDNS